jgi:hypothetical protein
LATVFTDRSISPGIFGDHRAEGMLALAIFRREIAEMSASFLFSGKVCTFPEIATPDW